MITTIPFSGFYETIHDHEITRAIEMMVDDEQGSVRDGFDGIYGEVNTSKAMEVYVSMYLENFAVMFNDETGLKVKFDLDGMDSPKEYNFTTDRIFAKVSRESVRAMYRIVDKDILDRTIRDKFTSRDGFISYYPNTLAQWRDKETRTHWSGNYGGPVDVWDSNMIGTLIEATLETKMKDFADGDWQWRLAEDMDSNGKISNAVYEGLTDNGKRLVKLADYLRERDERKYRKVA